MTAALVTYRFRTVVGDIFIWSMTAKHSVNSHRQNCSLEILLLTYVTLLT